MKEGRGLSDIHKRLQNVYGDDTIDRSNVYWWMKKFKEGETRIQEKAHRGRSSPATRDDFEEDSTVGLNDGAHASLSMMETMLSSTFI